MKNRLASANQTPTQYNNAVGNDNTEIKNVAEDLAGAAGLPTLDEEDEEMVDEE